ncbi:MAG: C-type polyheme cytochrome OmcB [Desulfuromonadales bacterium]|nr:C-type polyheme cytochrome OmcB [Desulfuromonadales bacterium]
MRIRKFRSISMCILSLALFINGCGSSSRESGISANNIARVGDTACIQCHSAVTEPLTGQSIITQYLNTSPHNTAALGCEACHGGGAQHNGVGPIPFPKPDVARCQTCHNGIVAPLTSAARYVDSKHATDTPSHLPGGSGNTSYICSRCHTSEGAILANIAGVTGDDGNLQFFNAANKIAYSGTYTAINCITCHEHGAGLRPILASYSTAKGSGTGTTIWNPSKTSDAKNNQFNLCTSCHNLYNYDGTKVIATGTSGTRPYITGGSAHNTRWNRIIASTHKEKGMATSIPFNNMTSAADGTNTRITGYALRMVAPPTTATTVAGKNYVTDPYYSGPCFDCHGHEANTNTGSSAPQGAGATIHTDWAQSAHGGQILTKKYAAYAASGNARTTAGVESVMQAYSDDTNAIGWTHYNWDSTLTSAGADDRGSCQKCHTATGFSNFANSPTTYDPVKNNFSHLQGWTQKAAAGASTGGSKRQNEVLYCWGCHSNAGTGKLRNPGPVTTDYTFNGAPVTFPNVGNSNVCVVCHGGRGNTQSARSSRFEGHHGTTAGMLFASVSHIGSEFAGKDYTPPSFFAHDKINASTSGPCASCHMQAAAKHTFSVVSSSSATGLITKIRSQAICDTCHTGTFAMTPTKLNDEEAGFTEATNLLLAYLANTVTNAYNTNINAIAVASMTDAQYSAFQNAKLPGDSPGAWAHNRFYAKRLIFDSLDAMQHGATLTGSLTLSPTLLSTYPNAAVWLGANATTGVATRP